MEYDPSIDIAEDPEVYPPSDDSILLIESLDVVPGEKVLEVGCGSGVVSIHCAKNGCDVTAVDVNPRAVELARRNAGANGADIPVCESDVYGNVDDVFDTIVFNLPYPSRWTRRACWRRPGPGDRTDWDRSRDCWRERPTIWCPGAGSWLSYPL